MRNLDFRMPALGQEEEAREELVAAALAIPVREIFRRFWPYARPYRRWLPLLVLLVALGPATETAAIWMYKVLAQMAASRLSALFTPLGNVIELAGVLAVVGTGVCELSQGRLTIGGLLVFIVCLSRLYAPIEGLTACVIMTEPACNTRTARA